MKLDSVTDNDIQALIDNELDPERARQVHLDIAKNRAARKRYQELNQQKTLLNLWWKSQLQ